MGDIAEGMINGDFDFYTGEYIGRGFGYPRTRGKELPWEKATKDQEWKRVVGLMQAAGIKNHLHPEVVKAYGATYPANSGLRKACTHILKEFEKFRAWLNENKQNWTKPKQP